MGIDDIANQAKDLAAQHSDKVEQGVDAAAEQIKKVVPEAHSDKVDQAADAVKGLVDKAGGGPA
jgi:hypothetical protein